MSRYNHFSEIKNKRVLFGNLSLGSEFSFSDTPFKKCRKESEVAYYDEKNKELKRLFGNTFKLEVYVR